MTSWAWTVPSAPAGIDREREIVPVAAICRAWAVAVDPDRAVVIDQEAAIVRESVIDPAWAAVIVPNFRASVAGIVPAVGLGIAPVLESAIVPGAVIVSTSTTSMLATSTLATTT